MNYTDPGDNLRVLPSEYLFGDDRLSAEFYGVHVRTIKNWKRTNHAPLMALRLMRLRMDGDLSALGGKAWHGFRFGRDGLFYHPAWRRGFTPGELNGMFHRVQGADKARRDLAEREKETAQLRAEIEKLRAQLWAAEKVRTVGAPWVLSNDAGRPD